MAGHNGPFHQAQSERFIEALIRGTDSIAVLRPSKWTDKAYDLWTIPDNRVQLLSKALYNGVIINADKCTFIEPDEIKDLPDGLAQEVPDDDVYLFQSALASGARVIATSDQRLITRVVSAHKYNLTLRLRQDFIREYLNGLISSHV